ncbi:MAG: hypothetical protein ACI9UN_004933 [Granulosicoccus sp.]|jgi:hypothetical protein
MWPVYLPGSVTTSDQRLLRVYDISRRLGAKFATQDFAVAHVQFENIAERDV